MIRVTLVFSPAPRVVQELTLDLPEGTPLAQALAQSGWPAQFPELATEGVTCGIWGRKAPLDATLRDGDRVEFYRGLRVDPKVARRERFVGQGARGAGLFAQRRPNSKSGY